MVDQVREHAVREAAQDVKEKIQEFSEQAAEKLEGVCDQANEFIQEKPYVSLSLAFGAGLLVGLLFFRRN